MRCLWLALPIAALLGCASPASPRAISCQPYGYTPAPIAFSFQSGPVTASVAEATAVAFFRACHDTSPTITDVRWTSEAATGSRGGPNNGQAVWIVKVQATVPTPPEGSYESHSWIEVNQATGVPTLIAYG
jgi:hypothetical protein